MNIAWSSWRTWRRIAIGIAGLLFLLLLALRLFAMTPWAHAMLEARIEAASVRGQTIEVDGLKGDLLGKMQVDSLTVADAQGIWLSATEIDLKWRPLGLLSSHLNISEISAAAIDTSRRPTFAPSQPTGRSVITRYTIGALDVTRLSFADGVVGPEQIYEMTGAARIKSKQGDLDFALTTRGPVGDTAYANLVWGGDVPLLGTLKIEAAPNGLIATLLNAPADTPLIADLEAARMPGKWQLVAEGAVGDQPTFDIALDVSDQASTAEGRLRLDQLGILAPARVRLGDTLIFDGEIDASNQLEASVSADTLSAALTGTVQTSFQGAILEDLDLSASDIDAARLTALSGLSLPALSAKGTLFLRTDRRAFQGNISAPNLSYDAYELRAAQMDGSVGLNSAALVFDGQLSAAAIRGLPAQITSVLTGPLTLDLTANYLFSDQTFIAEPFAINSPALTATGTAWATRNGAVDVAADIELTTNTPISELTADLTVTGERFDSLDIALSGDAVVAPDETVLRNLVGDRAAFSISARRIPAGIDLRSAQLQNDRLDTRITGMVGPNAIDLSGRVTMPSLQLDQIAASQFDATFDLDGFPTAPEITLQASAEEMDLSRQIFTRPQLSARASLAKSAPFTGALSATYMEAPLTITLQGAREVERIEVSQVRATWADLEATGQAEITTQALRASTMALNLTGRTPIGGEVNGAISYQAETLDSDLSLTDLTLGETKIAQGHLALAGTWPTFDGTLDYQAKLHLLGTPQSIDGKHELTVDAAVQTLSLTGRSTLAGNAVTFTEPLILAIGDTPLLSGAVSGLGGDIDLRLDPSGVTPSRVTINGLEVAQVGPLLDRPSLLGTMDAQVELAIKDGALTGNGTATINDLARGIVESAAADLQLDILVEDNLLTGQLSTADPDMELDLFANISAPLVHQNTLPSIRVAPNAEIPVTLRANGALGPIWALAAPTNLRLAGSMDVDIDNGVGTSWRFEGPISLQNAVFEDGITGVHLKDISASAQLRPDGIDVDQFDARGSNGGRVSGNGLYGFDGNGAVTLSLNGLNAFKRSDVSGAVSGTATIERRNRRTQINGDLELDQARVNLERLPGAGYTTLDVVFRDAAETDEVDTPVREAIELQLNVEADRRIFVTGSGVDTEWGLDVRVTGPLGRPSIIGRANLVRGEADLLSRRFRFSEGAVRFVGEPSDAQIAIRADRTDDDITASIALTGTVTDPEISLSSDPSLPNDEILSRVLFGRSPSELSPLQAAQLAGAAAQLAGGDALNLVGQIQQATGLDRLDIGLDDEGAATLATGKYLADDIYLEIESGVTGAPGVALEWTPLENVAIDAEVDPELGPKVAIQWKRDFDRLPGEPE